MKTNTQILFAALALLCACLSGCATEEAAITTTTTTTESTLVQPAAESTTETRTIRSY